jgi:ADP-ribosylglycohydrolase
LGEALSAEEPFPVASWTRHWNPDAEMCGAAIRVDAYAYACAGSPARAVELAHRDASCTHRGTGVYAAMFFAAAIATAFVASDPREIFEIASMFVPQRSRFYAATADCLAQVCAASDWLDGYERIHSRYGEWGHCRLYQEVGTVMNSVRFAQDIGHGICLQAMQGNDTDSFCALTGSILGAYFGPAGLVQRWLTPFNNRIHTTLADFHEQDLAAVTRRMAALPELVAARPE